MFQIFSFLKTIQFVNPAGDLVNMNQNKKLETEYDIFYITDFRKQEGLKMKIGRFSGHFPNGQQLFMSDDMIEWATDIKQVIWSSYAHKSFISKKNNVILLNNMILVCKKRYF